MERFVVEESLRDVTDRLWHGMLGLCARETVTPGSLAEEITARIEIRGEWNGDVSVCIPRQLAQRVAAVMFGLEEGVAATSEQLFDCIKEIANITAGNLKTALPEPCELSIPVVEPLASADRETAFLTLSFDVDQDQFQLILNKRAL